MHNRLIINSLSSHLAVLDADGTIIQVNKAWKEFGECSNLKLHNTGVGTNYLEVLEKSAQEDPDIQVIFEGIQKVIQGKSSSFECDYPCHSPEEQRWFTLQATPMESKKGTVITHTNVTPRYSAEHDLRLSESRLKLATKNAHIGIWDWDVANNILVWDDSMYELYGVDKKDFTGAFDAWEKTLHPEDKEMATQQVELALQDKKPLDMVFRILINESTRYITAKAEVDFDADGQAIRMTGANIDITQEKQAELLIKQTKERLQEVIHYANVGIVYANSRVEIVGCNKKFVELLEYDKESDLFGLTLDKFTHPEDLSEELVAVKRFESGELDTFDLEKRYITNQGNVKWVHLYVSVVRDNETNEPIQYVAMVTDISDRISTEREKLKLMYMAEEQERNRISHDLHDGLGQSIAAASLYINALEPYVIDSLEQDGIELYKTCKKLIKNSVEETRLVSHNFMPRTLQQFGLDKTIDSVIKNYQRIKSEINFDFKSNLESTRFNQDMELSLFRIIQELLNNAIKHSKADQIKVSLNLDDGSVVAVVSDNGKGICEEENCGDEGIGLRNIKERVSYLGGTIEVHSKEDQGVSTMVCVKY